MVVFFFKRLSDKGAGPFPTLNYFWFSKSLLLCSHCCRLWKWPLNILVLLIKATILPSFPLKHTHTHKYVDRHIYLRLLQGDVEHSLFSLSPCWDSLRTFFFFLIVEIFKKPCHRNSVWANIKLHSLWIKLHIPSSKKKQYFENLNGARSLHSFEKANTCGRNAGCFHLTFSCGAGQGT